MSERRTRLSIDVTPTIRRKLKMAAAERDTSMREVVESLLRQALESDDQSQTKDVAGAIKLTAEQQQRGLEALAALEKLDRELLQKRGGGAFSSSWEVLEEARSTRTRDLAPEP